VAQGLFNYSEMWCNMSDDFMDIMRKMYREENNSDTGRGSWFLPPEIAQGIADGTYTVLTCTFVSG